MASISVVLLGLNPETRLKTVVDYLKGRGVPGEYARSVHREGRGAAFCVNVVVGVGGGTGYASTCAAPGQWGWHAPSALGNCMNELMSSSSCGDGGSTGCTWRWRQEAVYGLLLGPNPPAAAGGASHMAVHRHGIHAVVPPVDRNSRRNSSSCGRQCEPWRTACPCAWQRATDRSFCQVAGTRLSHWRDRPEACCRATNRPIMQSSRRSSLATGRHGVGCRGALHRPACRTAAGDAAGRGRVGAGG